MTISSSCAALGRAAVRTMTAAAARAMAMALASFFGLKQLRAVPGA